MISLLVSLPGRSLEDTAFIEPRLEMLLGVLHSFFLSLYFVVSKALEGNTENLEQL